jgi:hypothetical protein
MVSSRTRAPLALVAALLAAVLALAACSGGSGGGSGQAAASRTTATTATTAAPGTTLPGSSDTCPTFHGATTSLTSSGPTAPAFLVDAVAGVQGCLDAVTFTFQTRGDGTPPGYTVRYRDQTKEPFQDGDPPSDIQIDGAATLFVSMAPATSVDTTVPDNPQQTYTGNLSLSYGDHHHLVIVRELPDAKDPAGQDTVNWVIGLDSARPFRVDRAEDPPRVTILIG